jgi:electron transport complex protein RnfC
LLPQELQWSAKAKDHQQLMKLNLFDCIDCGACAYVCPSQIPLVQYYRVAKAEIRQQQQLDIKSEKAKARFEARKFRLEQEKVARQEKHEKAAAARKVAMNKKSADGGSASSAVAAALARVKAKKAAESNNTELPVARGETQNDNEQTEISPVQAAIARAKAKKLAKANSAQAPVTISETQSDDKHTEISPVQAAIERAKAKRLAKANSTLAPVTTNETQSDDQHAEISPVQAAIARAKAKKLVRANSTEPSMTISEQVIRSVPVTNEIKAEQSGNKKQIEDNEIQHHVINDKKARIAAAVAKAKAKKAQENKSSVEQSKLPIEIKQDITGEKTKKITTEIEDKKARIASAVAKAKAKAELKRMDKAQQTSTTNNEEST